MVGVAVKVTEGLEEHIEVDEALILAEGTNVELTVIVLEAEALPHEPPVVVRVSVTVEGAVAEAV